MTRIGATRLNAGKLHVLLFLLRIIFLFILVLYAGGQELFAFRGL